MRLLSVVLASASLVLLACGGAIAPVDAPPESRAAESAEPPREPGDAGCDAASVEAWCGMVARGGTGVDPRADACCTRWIDDSLRDE